MKKIFNIYLIFYFFIAAGSGSRVRISNADPDPGWGGHLNADPSGTASETLLLSIIKGNE